MKRDLIIITLISLMISGIVMYVFVFTASTGYRTILVNDDTWERKRSNNFSRLEEVPIILYHNIDGKGVFSLPLDVLRNHFELFKSRNIDVISLCELEKRTITGVKFNNRSLCITFDDGYYSMYSKLLPLAKEFGYPITLFVYLDNVYHKARASITWKNLREMDENGIDVQCHSISHPDLTALSKMDTVESRYRIYEEIYLAKRTMEQYMGKTISYFAFPYGRYDLKLIELCRYAGYKRVFSTDYGSNVITRTNYCLRRHHVKRTYSLQTIESIAR
ncbi:MAG: polysaccharide deacetylase family protein [Spirochaetota bacterium]